MPLPLNGERSMALHCFLMIRRRELADPHAVANGDRSYVRCLESHPASFSTDSHHCAKVLLSKLCEWPESSR